MNADDFHSLSSLSHLKNNEFPASHWNSSGNLEEALLLMVSSKDSSQANAGMSVMIRFKMESFQLDMQSTGGDMRFKVRVVSKLSEDAWHIRIN
jgi:hypothetical protein